MRKVVLMVSLIFSLAVNSREYSVRFFDETDGLSHGHVSEVLQDSTGVIWIATWNGLNRYNGTHFESFKAAQGQGLDVPNDIIRRLYLREDNNLLCRIEDRVLLFNTAQCRFDTLSREEEGLAYQKLHKQIKPDQQPLPVGKDRQYGRTTLPNILNDYEDHQGNIWSVALFNGLYLSTPLPEVGKHINHQEVRTIYERSDGSVLASVREGKCLQVFDAELNSAGFMDANGGMHQAPVSFGSLVYCIYETRDGRLLLGRKPGGLIELADGRQRVYDQMPNAYDIGEDREGRLWVATFGAGLWRSDGRHEDGAYRWLMVEGTEDMQIRRLVFTEDDAMLCATTSGLVVVDNILSAAPHVRRHQRETGNPHSLNTNAVMSIFIKEGIVYIGTEGGGVNTLPLAEIYAEHPSFSYITTRDGLMSDIVYEITNWSNHELLIQGNTALNLYNTRTRQITTFSKSYFGSAADSKWGEVKPIELDRNVLLVAPVSGIVALDKTALQPIHDSIRIMLSSIERNGKREYCVDPLNEITLAPHQRSLMLSFAALDYRNHGELLYSTRLYKKGEEAAWSAPSTVSDIFIQDIRPGEYFLEIRSTNAYGHMQNNTRRIAIHVIPTFTESTWGWLLMGALALAIVVVITVVTLQLRTSRKKRAETLEAYLNLQERLSVYEQQQKQNPHFQVPEIISSGYTSENEQFMNTLHHFLEENLSNSELLIEDIAASTNMSRASLNRKMKELFNLTPRDFIQAARIKHACSLLETTDMSAKEVAYACGFSDQRYFSKCFKADTGKTPTEWRTSKSAKA